MGGGSGSGNNHDGIDKIGQAESTHPIQVRRRCDMPACKLKQLEEAYLYELYELSQSCKHEYKSLLALLFKL